MDRVGSRVSAQEGLQRDDPFAKFDIGGVAEGDDFPDPIGSFGTDPLVEGFDVADDLCVVVLPRAVRTPCGVEILL